MKDITLNVPNEALAVLALIQPNEKGAVKGEKRIIRIRKNLFRELSALNKEIKRHRAKITIN